MKRTFYRKLFQKNSFLQKMLLSILGLICVPLLGIQLYSLVRSTNEFQKVNSGKYVTVLQSLGDSFRNELESLSLAALRISLDDAMEVPVRANARPYAISEASYVLQKYNSIHPLTSSAGIYYRDADKVMRNTIINNLEYFSYGFYREGSEGAVQLQTFFRELDSPDCCSTQGKDGCISEVLFFARPVTIPSLRKNETVVFFTVEKKTLENWCATFIPSGVGFCILSETGDILFRSGAFTALMEEETVLEFLGDNSRPFCQTDGEDASVLYKYRDAGSGRMFLAAVPRSSSEGTVEAYARKATMLLAVTGLLVCVLLAVTLYINYKPVVELLSRHMDSRQQIAGMSELELIDSHFFALDEKLNDQNRLLATFVLGDLLSGQQVSREDLERYFPEEVYRCFAVAVTDVFLSHTQARVVSEELERQTGGLLLVTSIPNQQGMVFLYGGQNALDIALLQRLTEPLIGNFAPEPPKLCFGTAVAGVSGILPSYREALSASLPKVTQNSSTDDAWVAKQIRKLEQEFAEGAVGKAMQTMNLLERIARDAGIGAKRYFYFRTVNACLSGLRKNRPEISAEELDRLICLADAQSQDPFPALRGWLAELRSERGGDSADDADGLCAKMLSYVDRNCTDSNLCLTAVADHLQTSIYIVSRLFKEKTGLGFKEYITNKRLERACSLLTSSAMTVTEIAAACGFESSSYFGAVFRNTYGCSPTKYRDKQKLK